MKVREPPAPTEWRFVQGLHAVNAAVHARAPAVPNPYMILTQTPAKAKWFTLVDLSNAYVSIPVHPDSQYWFALMFDGQPYCVEVPVNHLLSALLPYSPALHHCN